MKLLFIALMTASAIFCAPPWEIVKQGAAEENPIKRAQAIAALGTIRTPQADKLVEAALADRDPSVRLTAVSALAERKSRATIPRLRAALADDSGEVSFTAAKALWEIGDRSGQELLEQVLSGERKQSAGF